MAVVARWKNSAFSVPLCAPIEFHPVMKAAVEIEQGCLCMSPGPISAVTFTSTCDSCLTPAGGTSTSFPAAFIALLNGITDYAMAHGCYIGTFCSQYEADPVLAYGGLSAYIGISTGLNADHWGWIGTKTSANIAPVLVIQCDASASPSPLFRLQGGRAFFSGTTVTGVAIATPHWSIAQLNCEEMTVLPLTQAGPGIGCVPCATNPANAYVVPVV